MNYSPVIAHGLSLKLNHVKLCVHFIIYFSLLFDYHSLFVTQLGINYLWKLCLMRLEFNGTSVSYSLSKELSLIVVFK